MLVWKIQTLNINVASLRYRCLFPLRYLAQRGITSEIYGGKDTVKLTPQTQAIIFVKSFHTVDVETCRRAYKQGIPIILDLCDNIFIDGYGADSSYVPAQNFRLMADKAAAIVTTGTAMKAEVEALLSAEQASDLVSQESSHKPLVVVIPDGSESIDDIKFAFRSTRAKRQRSLTLKSLKLTRQLYQRGWRKLKATANKLNSSIKRILHRYRLLTLRSARPVPKNGSKAAEHPTSQKTRRKNPNEPAPLWPKPWPAAPDLKTVYRVV